MEDNKEKSVYERKLNIFNKMKELGISITAISKKSGLKYATLRDKLIGRTEFKVEEAITVYNTFFKQYDFNWLFTKEEEE